MCAHIRHRLPVQVVVLVLEHLRLPPAQLPFLVFAVPIRVADSDGLRTRHEGHIPRNDANRGASPGITQARLKLSHHSPRPTLNARIEVRHKRQLQVLLRSELRYLMIPKCSRHRDQEYSNSRESRTCEWDDRAAERKCRTRCFAANPKSSRKHAYTCEHGVHGKVLNVVTRHVLDETALLPQHYGSRLTDETTLFAQTGDLQHLPGPCRLVHGTNGNVPKPGMTGKRGLVEGGESGYFPIAGRTTNPWHRTELSITMASLVKITVQNLLKARSVAAPVVARSFAYRTLKIDPVGVFARPLIAVACRQ